MSESSEARSQAYYDDFSDWYERERGAGYHRMIDDLEIEAVGALASGAEVLEVGCGTGLILGRLAQVASRAWGVDVSPGMLESAQKRGLRTALASATALPFADNSFDLVCSFKVLAHVSEIGRALSEAARVTRPGGHMALEFYNPWSLRYLAKRIAGPQPISDGRTEADIFTRWDSPSAVRRLLPPGVVLEDFRGVRVLTPAAIVHKLPLIGTAMVAAEHAALSSSLRFFGGFLIALIRKEG